LNGTVWLGSALNGLLALAAWWMDRRLARTAPLRPRIDPPARARTQRTVAPSASHGAVMILAMISGSVTFALQVLWNRAFAQVHENSMYSFSVIVAVVILALAIGGQLARIGLRRGIEPHRLLGGGWMAGGLAVVIGPWLFIRLSDGLSYLPAGSGWFGDAFELVRLAAALLLVPMALLGLGLPAVMEQAGRDVAGSVAGALLAGFVLPDSLGLWGGMMWLGALIAMAGLWQWFAAEKDRRRHVLGYALLAGWIISAFAFSAIDLPRVRLMAERGEALLSLAEGSHGITAVVGREGARRLKLNNFYSLGGTKATADERMQAHLPLLLHPNPQQVAFLGLGTGITAGGAPFHPVQELTVIELVPEVVTAARSFFGEANHQVLNDARTRVVHDDARHFLRGSGKRFDVIVGDLVVPWRQGEGALFTLEQFEAARLALKPGGLFCQWLPLFQLSETELNILIRTFLSVFPEAEVWRGDFSATDPALALVSRPRDFAIEENLVGRRLAEMKTDPVNPQLEAESVLWMHRVGVLKSGDLPAEETRLNTEDRPWIELLGPMLHAGGNRDTLFVGRRLQAWIAQVSRTTQERSAPLSQEAARGVIAGALFADLILCVDEENGRGAHAAQEKLKQTLPADSYRWFIAR
jgi:spermidine synthase